MADPVNERIILAPAIRGARTIVAPFQVEILQGDQLVVKYLGSTMLPQIPLSLQISFRMLSNGEVTSSRYIVPVTADGLVRTHTIALGAGFLLSMSAHPQFAALQGAFWCQASVTRTSGIEELYLMPLLQGYPTIAQVLAWPGSPLMAQSDGQWYPRRVIPPINAGQNWITTVPLYAQWQVTCISTFFTTSAAVANRVLRIDMFAPGPSAIFRTLETPAQTASQGLIYSWARGTAHAPTLSGQMYVDGIPDDMIIEAGYTVGVNVSGLQAADSWQQTNVMVLERLAFV